MDADFKETTVDRLHIRNAAVSGDEAVRKSESDAALATKAATSHTHAQLHDPATIGAGDGCVALSMTGQQISGGVTLAANSGLEKSSGLKVKFGTDSGTVSEGNHSHANDHAAVTKQDSDSIAISIGGQQISADLKVATGGGLKIVAGSGAAVDFGTGASQVSAGNHSHSIVTGSAPGFMSSAQLATLNALATAGALTVQDSNTVDLEIINGILRANVNKGAGLESDSNGLRVNFEVVASKDHNHAVVGGVGSYSVTNHGSGYTSPPLVTIGGNGSGATAEAVIGGVDLEIISGGSGYVVGQVIAIPGDLTAVKLLIYVSAVNGSGAITSAIISQAGKYDSAVPSSPIEFVSQSGTGATFDVTWGVTAITPVEYGRGYTNATVAFSGGGAAATASVATQSGFVSAEDVSLIADHETRLDGIDTDIAAIQSAIGDIGDLGTHETRLDGHDTQIASITSAITNIGAITTHETRLDGHDTQISAIQSQLDVIDEGALHNLTSNGLVVRTSADNYATRQITSSDDSLVITNQDGQAGNINIVLGPEPMQVLTFAASKVIDFNGARTQRMPVTANLTISTSNRSNGSKAKSVTLYLFGGSATYELAFAVGIHIIGTQITQVPAGKVVVVSLTSVGSNESDTIAVTGGEL